MRVVSQISVTLKNVPGTLIEVCDALFDINMNAICQEHISPTEVVVHIIANEAEAAKSALQSVGKVEIQDVLEFEVEHRPGAVASIAHSCQDAGVNIELIYSSASSGVTSTVYVQVDDLEKGKEACCTL